MQSVIKRPCPATRIHFQPYGQPNVERKTTTGERHPAASSRGHPSTGGHPRRGRRPRRPGNLPSPPIPGKTPGRACLPPTARRWASPMPSINAHGGVKTPPYGLTHQRVPAPAESSRGSPSTGSHPRRGRRPRRPGNLPSPPIPGKTPGPGMPGPYRAAVGKPHAIRKRPRRGQDPSLRTDPSTSARPYRAAVRERRQKKPRRSLFPGLPRFFI